MILLFLVILYCFIGYCYYYFLDEEIQPQAKMVFSNLKKQFPFLEWDDFQKGIYIAYAFWPLSLLVSISIWFHERKNNKETK